jgi:hypothetical protein
MARPATVSLAQAVFMFVLYVLILLALAYVVEYFWNTYVVDLFTVVRPATSVTQILALMIVVSIVLRGI